MLFTHNLFWLTHILLILVVMTVKRLSRRRDHLLAWCLISLLLGRLALPRVLLGVIRLLLFLVEIHPLVLTRLLIGVLTCLLLGLLHVLKTVVINFDVDFPVRLNFSYFFDDLVANIIVALDHDEGETEAVEGSASVSFDDSKE